VDLHADNAEQSLRHTVTTLVQDQLHALTTRLAGCEGEIMDALDYSRANLGLAPLSGFPGSAQSDLGDWQAVAALLLTDKNTWRKQYNVKQGFPPGAGADKALCVERKKRISALVSELQLQDARQHNRLLEALSALRHLPDVTDNPEQWQTMLSLCRVLPVLAAQLTLVFQQHGVVDHAQVSMAAREALGSDEAPTQLAQKLDYTLQHILLDEFQDTAINQFELVRRLTRGWAEDNQANPDNPRTLFIVGDGMQSIYGFRDADVGLFIKARQQGFNGIALQPLDLCTNFRSDAPLVAWVNKAFQDAFPARDNLQRGEIRFSPSVAHRAAAMRTPVEMLAFTGDTHHARRAEAEHLASVISSGMTDTNCESIAVLVRTRNHLRHIVTALKARGIPWQAQDIDSLASSPVVTDLVTLCQALHNLADDVAWLALLRAPWCGLDLADLLLLAGSRGEQTLWTRMQDPAVTTTLSQDGATRLQAVNSILSRALELRERLPLRGWVEQTWLQLGGPATAQRAEQLADAQVLLTLLENMDSRGENYIPSVLKERLSRLYSQDSAADSKVHLMTLHKSKGLEFDWVIIPGLGETPGADSRELLAWNEYHSVGGETGFLMAMDDQHNRRERNLYNYLVEANKRKRQLEASRLLYVGCTRASKRLFLSATLTAEADAWKPPGSRSLLHCIWPAFEVACDLVTPEIPAPAQVVPQLGIRRLQTLKAVPLSQPNALAVPAPNIARRAQNSPQRHAGTLIHTSLQRLSACTGAELKDFSVDQYHGWWRARLHGAGLAAGELAQAYALVEHSVSLVLADPRGRWLLASEREDAHSEYALSCLEDDGRLAEYVIDRCYVDAGVRWIVDYKSAMPEAGQDLNQFLQQEQQRYLPQLRRYREAFAKIERIPVKTALYFTSLAHWMECE
jgi:ATP-dependent exoDNAse (exonuclease V) beta subunit